MPRIRKVQFWLNPTPLGEGPRWDAEITRANGRHERRTRISKREALALLEEAMG